MRPPLNFARPLRNHGNRCLGMTQHTQTPVPMAITPVPMAIPMAILVRVLGAHLIVTLWGVRVAQCQYLISSNLDHRH